jgi:succinoglycan biosynthesis protein ExoM
MLRRALSAVLEQDTTVEFSYEIVIVDNDKDESAREVVSQFCPRAQFPMAYFVEPEQNIARARNRALAAARGDFVAFIDDDEFPEKDWLLNLFNACRDPRVAGVLGPVLPYFEGKPPPWLVRGGFCLRASHATGEILNWKETRTGNVLLRREIVQELRQPFDARFQNGGEDDDFFRRMIARGRTFIWCNEAVVHETVPPERWTRKYLLKRALLRGQNQRHCLTLSSIAKSVVALLLYLCLLPALFFCNHRLFMQYLIRLFDHSGKLLAATGVRPLGQRYIQ